MPSRTERREPRSQRHICARVALITERRFRAHQGCVSAFARLKVLCERRAGDPLIVICPIDGVPGDELVRDTLPDQAALTASKSPISRGRVDSVSGVITDPTLCTTGVRNVSEDRPGLRRVTRQPVATYNVISSAGARMSYQKMYPALPGAKLRSRIIERT